MLYKNGNVEGKQDKKMGRSVHVAHENIQHDKVNTSRTFVGHSNEIFETLQ